MENEICFSLILAQSYLDHLE